MAELAAARAVLTEAPVVQHDQVVLTYDQRLLRRKRLVTARGDGFLVDLAAVTNMDDHWGFVLLDGRTIQVVAAAETLVQISGPGLLRLAWHIGNRHTPCQIEPDHLLIRADHVLESMLRGLGATLAPVTQPFRPEGGAYGTGRTMGHSHAAPDPGLAFGWHDHGDGQVHFHPPPKR